MACGYATNEVDIKQFGAWGCKVNGASADCRHLNLRDMELSLLNMCDLNFLVPVFPYVTEPKKRTHMECMSTGTLQVLQQSQYAL